MRAGFQILGILAAFAALVWSVAHANFEAGAVSTLAIWMCLMFLVTEGIEGAADEEDYY